MTIRRLLLVCLVLTMACMGSALAELSRPSARGGAIGTPLSGGMPAGVESEGAAYLKKLDPKLLAKLQKEGQVLLSEKNTKSSTYSGFIKAVCLFKGNKERIFKLILEPVKQPLYLPRLTGAKSFDKPTNGELVQFSLSVMMVDFTFHVRHWFYPEQSRVEWSLDPKYKNDIARQDGYWQLYAVTPDQVVAEYGTLVDTGLAVPQWIQDLLARQDIPTALTAFRAYINSNGTYRRPD